MTVVQDFLPFPVSFSDMGRCLQLSEQEGGEGIFMQFFPTLNFISKYLKYHSHPIK